jgi:2Fe-2S ferredoxin
LRHFARAARIFTTIEDVMPKVTYISPNGDQHEADVPVGNSVMEGALDNMIDGILAECGGSCTCATCHVYVDPGWTDKVGEPGEFENDLLEIVVDPEPNSRLSCQIKVTEELDGLLVHLPKSQI